MIECDPGHCHDCDAELGTATHCAACIRSLMDDRDRLHHALAELLRWPADPVVIARARAAADANDPPEREVTVIHMQCQPTPVTGEHYHHCTVCFCYVRCEEGCSWYGEMIHEATGLPLCSPLACEECLGERCRCGHERMDHHPDSQMCEACACGAFVLAEEPR